MKYGQELIEMLEKEIANYAEVMADRQMKMIVSLVSVATKEE